MTRARSDGDEDAASTRYPRHTTAFFGHADAERTLLDAYRGGRMPHAWLIGGPAGIGKATLAYRVARFVLAYPDPTAAAVQGARSLELDPAHGTVRRIAGQAHPDLIVLERTENENGVLRTVITVEQTGRTGSFFGSTAGEGGWRVCIVDSADELHPAAANKLLKVLEEPPARSIFLLVSHAPGRLLPTIRSRCRRLDLRPLAQDDIVRAVTATLDGEADAGDVARAAAAADGSVAAALDLLDGPALAIRERVLGLIRQLPAMDIEALHALGDVAADNAVFAAFIDTVRAWLVSRLHDGPQERRRLDRIAGAWEKVNSAISDALEYNLDRRPLVFAVFGMLAEAARG
jgi:DNA polymerase III subunit delta'